MATLLHLFNHLHFKGWQPLIPKKDCFSIAGRLRFAPSRRNSSGYRHLSSTCCFMGSKAPIMNAEQLSVSRHTGVGTSQEAASSLGLTNNSILLADLDPATAKFAINILGPFLSAFGFLFIVRIVMSWYPKLPVTKFPYVIVYAPTEPFLVATRKIIPPLGGVDVTPVVWFGLLSFLNEILVGPQGLLVLVSQQLR